MSPVGAACFSSGFPSRNVILAGRWFFPDLGLKNKFCPCDALGQFLRTGENRIRLFIGPFPCFAHDVMSNRQLRGRDFYGIPNFADDLNGRARASFQFRNRQEMSRGLVDLDDPDFPPAVGHRELDRDGCLPGRYLMKRPGKEKEQAGNPEQPARALLENRCDNRHDWLLIQLPVSHSAQPVAIPPR